MKPKGKNVVVDILSEYESVFNRAKDKPYVAIYTQAHGFHGFVIVLNDDSIKLCLCCKDGSMHKGDAIIKRSEIVAVGFP